MQLGFFGIGRFGCCGDDEAVFFYFFNDNFSRAQKDQGLHDLSDLDGRQGFRAVLHGVHSFRVNSQTRRTAR